MTTKEADFWLVKHKGPGQHIYDENMLNMMRMCHYFAFIQSKSKLELFPVLFLVGSISLVRTQQTTTQDHFQDKDPVRMP